VGFMRSRSHYEMALRWMREACDEHGIFLSLVMPHLKNEAELEIKYGHMVRINEDVGTGGWYRFSSYERGVRRPWWSQWANTFDGYTYWSSVSGREKLILDGDFIRINTMGNDDEKKSVISLHLMAGGPISVADQHHTIGSDLWLYQNTELLELNTDGFVGKPFTSDPTRTESQIWTGRMSNGDWIVGLFNRANIAAVRSINFLEIPDLDEPVQVRDLWSHTDLGEMTAYSVSVPPRGVVMLKLSTKELGQVAQPQFMPGGGVYSGEAIITISSSTAGAEIYYTMDGSEPSVTSQQYLLPIILTETTTLKAVAIKDEMRDSEIVSAEYVLHSLPVDKIHIRNFPNPFDIRTTFQFSLEKQTYVRLSVYDILGRKIAEVYEGSLDEGEHQIVFHANSSMSDGIYIYRLTYESDEQVNKFLYLK